MIIKRIRFIFILCVLTIGVYSYQVDTSGTLLNIDKVNKIQRTIDINCSQVINKTKFKVCYDYTFKTPILTSYYLTDKDISSKKQPRMYLKIEKSIPKEFRPSMTNYHKSGYDAGHLPATSSIDINPKAASDIASVNFCAPQDPYINRGVWRYIENKERYLAVKNKEILVITGVIPSPDKNKVIKGGVRIPITYWKLIYIENPSKGYQNYYFYVVPNSKKLLLDGKITNIELYRIPSKQVQEITGLVFNNFGLNQNIKSTKNIDLNRSSSIKIEEDTNTISKIKQWLSSFSN